MHQLIIIHTMYSKISTRLEALMVMERETRPGKRFGILARGYS